MALCGNFSAHLSPVLFVKGLRLEPLGQSIGSSPQAELGSGNFGGLDPGAAQFDEENIKAVINYQLVATHTYGITTIPTPVLTETGEKTQVFFHFGMVQRFVIHVNSTSTQKKTKLHIQWFVPNKVTPDLQIIKWHLKLHVDMLPSNKCTQGANANRQSIP